MGINELEKIAEQMNLKPCPFCGSQNVFIGNFQTNFIQTRYMVVCEDCQSHSRNSKTEEAAAEAWNRRADNG